MLGGGIRTSSDLTLPGFTHEVMASWHPLFTGSAAYAELRDDLDRHGLEYLNTDLPTGTVFPDGSAAFIAGSLDGQRGGVRPPRRQATGPRGRRQFDAFMANAELCFGVLSARAVVDAGPLARRARRYRRFGRRGLLEFAGSALVSCRDWLGGRSRRSRARAARAVGAAHRASGQSRRARAS